MLFLYILLFIKYTWLLFQLLSQAMKSNMKTAAEEANFRSGDVSEVCSLKLSRETSLVSYFLPNIILLIVFEAISGWLHGFCAHDR